MRPDPSKVANKFARQLTASMEISGGTWGYFPWEGDGPEDHVWSIQDAVDPTPGVKLLLEDFDKIADLGEDAFGYVAAEHWAWVGTVFLSAEALHGLPKKVVKKALEVVENLSNLEDYAEWEKSWRSPDKLQPAVQLILKELREALARKPKKGKVPLYRGSMKTSSKRVAARFMSARLTPADIKWRPDGKGNYTGLGGRVILNVRGKTMTIDGKEFKLPRRPSFGHAEGHIADYFGWR